MENCAAPNTISPEAGSGAPSEPDTDKIPEATPPPGSPGRQLYDDPEWQGDVERVSDTKYRDLCDIALFDISKWQSHVERVWGKEFIDRWDRVEDMLDAGYADAIKWPSEGRTRKEEVKFMARLIGWGLNGRFLTRVLSCTAIQLSWFVEDNPRLKKMIKKERALIRIDEEACSRADADWKDSVESVQARGERAVSAADRFWADIDLCLREAAM
ncbi:hypothetical protein ACJZ2D_002521 [Fusarium nematophilum]